MCQQVKNSKIDFEAYFASWASRGTSRTLREVKEAPSFLEFNPVSNRSKKLPIKAITSPRPSRRPEEKESPAKARPIYTMMLPPAPGGSTGSPRPSSSELSRALRVEPRPTARAAEHQQQGLDEPLPAGVEAVGRLASHLPIWRIDPGVAGEVECAAALVASPPGSPSGRRVWTFTQQPQKHDHHRAAPRASANSPSLEDVQELLQWSHSLSLEDFERRKI